MTQSTSGNVGTPGHARDETYAKQLATANTTGKCPFCDIDRNINPVDLRFSPYWRVWKCQPSYDFHARHLVIPACTHFTTAADLSFERVRDLQTTVASLIFKYGMWNSAFVMRSGNPSRTGSTLQHIHAHLQEPNDLGPAFAVFAHAVSSAQIEQLSASWYVKTFMMEPSVSPYGHISMFSQQVSKHIVKVAQEETHFQTSYTYKSSLDIWTTTAEPLVELITLWQDLIVRSSWEGSNLFIRNSRNGESVIKIIVPKGLGPVIEMIAPAVNEDQARWQINSFLTIARKREAADRSAAESHEAGLK